MLEFALTLPIVIPLGMYGIEISNYGLTQLKLSQIALTLADNASRVGVDSGLSTQEIRETDVNDVFQGLRIQGGRLDVTTNGRITLSSLETTTLGRQYIHWQRCTGLKRGAGFDSSYGNEGDGASIFDLFTGMGEPGAKVQAPPGAAVMFVELNYEYRPIFTRYFLGDQNLRAVASFIVRDKRDLDAGVTNPNPTATVSRCNVYAA